MFGDQTFYDAYHFLGEYSPENFLEKSDIDFQKIFLLSSSLTPREILEIPILKSELLVKTVVTNSEKINTFNQEIEENSEFRQFCEK